MPGTDLLWVISEERRREAESAARERLARPDRQARPSVASRLAARITGRPARGRERGLRPAAWPHPR